MKYKLPVRDENIKPIVDISEKVEEMGWGQITCTLRVHGKIIQDITWQSFERRRYGNGKK